MRLGKSKGSELRKSSNNNIGGQSSTTTAGTGDRLGAQSQIELQESDDETPTNNNPA